MKATRKSSPSQFGTLCGILLSGNNLACCVAPVLSAYIVASYSWRTSVSTAGLTSMILCLFAVIVLQRSLKKSEPTNDDKATELSNRPKDPTSSNSGSPSINKVLTSSNNPEDSSSTNSGSPNINKVLTSSNNPEDPSSTNSGSPSIYKVLTASNSPEDPSSTNSGSPSIDKALASSNSPEDPSSTYSGCPSIDKALTSSNSPEDPSSANSGSPSIDKVLTSSNSPEDPFSTNSDSPNIDKALTSSNCPEDPSSTDSGSPSNNKGVTSLNNPNNPTSADPDLSNDDKIMHQSIIPVSNDTASSETFTDLLKDPFLWLVSIGYLVISCYHTTLLDWGQLFLIAQRKRTKKEGSFFISSMEIGGFVGGIVAGYLSDLFIKYRKKVPNPKTQVTAANSRLFVLGIFMLVVVVFLHLLHSAIEESSSFVWIVFLGCVLGIFVYGSDAIIGVLSSECAPLHLSGSALAVSSLVGNVGAMITGYPFCTIAKHFSWTVVFVILEVTTLLMLIAIIVCRNLQPKHLRRRKAEYPLQVP